MHVILTSIGTDGDIFPFAGLGSRLRSLGHSATLVVSEEYRSLAEANELGFHPLVSAAENRELFDHPDFWHPLKTGPMCACWGMRMLERQYELISSLISRDTVIVSNPGVFAAALASEKQECPIANVILQPWLIPSSVAPPLMPGMHALRHAPGFIWKLFWRTLDLYGDILIGRDLNRFRARLGLKAVRRVFKEWLSPQLVLGMFPDWYGPPASDWPNQIQLVGFPFSEQQVNDELPTEVRRFCDSGNAPIVFTFGTGMRHSATLFRLASDAIAQTEFRAIFLTKHRDQLPQNLPASILHCEYASFQQLFPRCAAIVHHGGIGTASQAMRAGTPQLIMPICFDQADNGDRVRRLGVGDWLKHPHQKPLLVAKALSRLMSDKFRSRCREVQNQLTDSDGLTQAARKIEQLGLHKT